jgi:hypothetical protein
MKVVDKPLLIGDIQVGQYQIYDEVENELQITSETPKMTRVLPSPFFYEKRLHFFLIKRYEPGEKATFPNGGFEVRDEGGAMRSYDLDQVIIHPFIIKHKKTLDKMARRAQKIAQRKERISRKEKREDKPKYGRRGRPALNPEEKAKREAEKAAKNQLSGGRRGRPRLGEIREPKVKKESSAGRGRPALSPEIKAAREAEKAAKRLITGGKRGRPAKKKL